MRAAPSKSATHRALVAAALARGASRILNPLDADDTRATLAGIEGLGLGVERVPGAWAVRGGAGEIPGGGVLALGESGTTFRFLTAVAALGLRPSTLDGAPRLRERPVGELAAALASLGAEVRLDPASGGLPLVAGGRRLHGGRLELPPVPSSQFASALLLIGARLEGGLELTLSPPTVSLPYVDLTARVLQAFGVTVRRTGPLGFKVEVTDYGGCVYEVEGDHSSASYFLAAAAVAGGRVRVDGLCADSGQPDARLASLLEAMGCAVSRGPDWIEVEGAGTLRAFDLNLGEAPDLVPTLAVLALFADGPCRIGGVGHLRFKESDRLAALLQNLDALGRAATAREGSLEIDGPGRPLVGALIRTHSDHRMAMAFAVAGLRVPGLAIDDPACVSKSNPNFWSDWERLQVAP